MKRNRSGVPGRRDPARRGPVREETSTPDAVVVRAVVVLVAFLMTYSVIWWLVGFKEAAGVAALGACGLAAEITRRLLRPGKSTPRSPK